MKPEQITHYGSRALTFLLIFSHLNIKSLSAWSMLSIWLTFVKAEMKLSYQGATNNATCHQLPSVIPISVSLSSSEWLQNMSMSV